ncbi:MAG TPA: VWA domain-containing protein [Pyrinomonadaceae bacterium]|nr:VWA domain-containing protein [Pyrinomonadaceae bacterium]
MTFFQSFVEKLSRKRSFTILFLICEIGVICGQTSLAAETCETARQRTIALSVATKEGASVDNLRPEDLAVLENKTTREILKLESLKDLPLSMAIMIDVSTSQERTLAGTKLAAQELVKNILHSDKDRAAVVSFTSEATIEQDSTNDVAKLLAAIERLKFVRPPGYIGGGVVVGPKRPQNLPGATALWDAIEATVKRIQSDGGSRRVLVILTDGEDTYSRASVRDAIERAAVSNVAVFSIGIADEKYYTVNRDQLQKLSEETGGRAFFPKKIAELEGIFRQTMRDLESQYALTYCTVNPKVDRKPVKIKIDLKNPVLVQSKLRLSYPRYSL